MASYTYKNMLIHERGSKNSYAKTLVKDKFNTWFTMDFHPKHIDDKIIMFLPSMTASDHLVRLGDTDGFSNPGLPTGIIKLFCNANIITIDEIQFATQHGWNTYLPMFREYLIKTIQEVCPDLKQVDIIGYVINWGTSLKTETIENAVSDAGLISDRVAKTHSFTSGQVSASTQAVFFPAIPALRPVVYTDPPSFKFGNKAGNSFKSGVEPAVKPTFSFWGTPEPFTLGSGVSKVYPTVAPSPFKFGGTDKPAVQIFNSTENKTSAEPAITFCGSTTPDNSGGSVTETKPVASTNAFGCGPVASTNAFGCGSVASTNAFGCGPVASTNAFGCGSVASTNAFGCGSVASTNAFGCGPVASTNAFGCGSVTETKPVASTNAFGETQKTTIPAFGETQKTTIPAFGETQKTTIPAFGMGISSTTNNAFGFGKMSPTDASTNKFGFGTSGTTPNVFSFSRLGTPFATKTSLFC